MSYGIGIVALSIAFWIAGPAMNHISKQLGEPAPFPRADMAVITVMSVITAILGMTLIGYACVTAA
ncbi:hypothetical protein [Mycobacteroides abscessus]|uniref:hypothetical protein n=1 Tax=Mycobacteroides abscessus TaxID=36809 RepID=UPI0013000B6B|nr:hypothetical protein [Mycobacteroides abscessus]